MGRLQYVEVEAWWECAEDEALEGEWSWSQSWQHEGLAPGSEYGATFSSKAGEEEAPTEDACVEHGGEGQYLLALLQPKRSTQVVWKVDTSSSYP